MCPEILIITGDFNFHQNYSTNSDANTFTELLETFGLLQYISLPTHVSGHILDLVITRSSDDICICSIHISSLRISDHNFVHAKFSIPRPHLSVEKVKFHKIKQINGESFKSDLKASNLCTTSRSNLDDMVKCYDETLTDLLESHAPLKTKVIVVRPRVPWFSEELKCVKSKRRKQERKLLKTGSKCDRDAYRCVCNQYSALLKTAKGSHYTDLIDQCSGDSKKLFRILNLLCEKIRPILYHHILVHINWQMISVISYTRKLSALIKTSTELRSAGRNLSLNAVVHLISSPTVLFLCELMMFTIQ